MTHRKAKKSGGDEQLIFDDQSEVNLGAFGTSHRHWRKLNRE